MNSMTIVSWKQTAMSTRLGLEHDSIIPDVIDSAPKHKIRIHYPSGADVTLGNELTPTQVKDEPWDISWPHDGSLETLYTLVMVDPDAPSRVNPEIGEALHWLVVNIPFNRISNGTTMAEYIGSGPPEGTGMHRYIFLVYRQSGRINPDQPVVRKTALTGRIKFKVRDFAKKYNLGEPVAANYYQAQYDAYCPVLMEQFTDKSII